MTCKLLRFSCVLWLLLLACSASFAQVADSTAIIDSIVTDSAITDSSETLATVDSATDDDVTDTLVEQAFFKNDEDSILKWRRGSEFNYMAYLDSFLRKRKDLRQDTMDVGAGSLTKRRTASADTSYASGGSSMFLNSGPVKIFFWIFAAVFIVFIIYRLFFKNNLFAKQKIIKEDALQEDQEPLNNYAGYAALIHGAEANNDHNLAVRYLYLQSIAHLAEKNVIVFMPDKTNNDYVRELAGRSFQPKFAWLTSRYEYAWFGKFLLDTASYFSIKEEFIAFNKTV